MMTPPVQIGLIVLGLAAEIALGAGVVIALVERKEKS